MPKVLIGGPAKQDTRIFKEHLESVLSQKTTAECELFYVVNDCPELISFLGDSEYTVLNTGDKYITTEQTHYWNQENLTKMETLRNRFIEEALKRDCDYAMFVDTDLVLRPETLETLLSRQEKIIAELFLTPEAPGSDKIWPNAWHSDQCSIIMEELASWVSVPGVYEVGGTGACMLVDCEVFRKGVNYTRIPNIQKILYGEDRWFCIRAVCNGYRIMLDTTCQPTHLYRMSEYFKFMEGKYARID